MRDGRTPGVAPWSFFVPVALAVLVGAVVAGLILRGIDGVPGNDDASPVIASPGSTEDAVRVPAEASDPVRAEVDAAVAVPVLPETVVSPAHAPGVASSAPDEGEEAVASVPTLPGALVAKRDGARKRPSAARSPRDENG